jgi:glycine/D-amino acid oxidase-like deaminating enzyme
MRAVGLELPDGDRDDAAGEHRRVDLVRHHRAVEMFVQASLLAGSSRSANATTERGGVQFAAVDPNPGKEVAILPRSRTAIVVGAGIFGLTSALELRERGYAVTLLDPGPVPHPLAASTDISKVVRIEYGADETYTRLAEEAREGWLAWNRNLFSTPLYHETGATFLSREPMMPGGYEYENFQMLTARGHAPERLTPSDIRQRFPAWNTERYVDGYFNPKAGFVESGKVVATLAECACARGVDLRAGAEVSAVNVHSGEVHTTTGETRAADVVVLAVGAWTPVLLPELAGVMRPTGQPVFHLRPADPERFSPPRFVVFGADSSRTGWYGFPAHPDSGVVKIANHGPGWPVHPTRDPRTVPDAYAQRLRTFLAKTFPELADAPLVSTRCCLYCDTPDEHFWITRHPDNPALTVAAGDSGHAFKFAPVLGRLIADAVEGKSNAISDRFAWRTFSEGMVGQEASRAR